MKIIITETQHRMLKHIYQPNGISCGPTCIKMAAEFFKGEVDSIDAICKKCGTDNITGTPPDRMRKGLDSMGIVYVEHINEEDPYQSIRDVIDNGSLAIVRTITHGVPHWIVIYNYEENLFIVNDPWLGQLQYTVNDLNEIWKEREYFFFEIVREGNQI
jgi:ABC-type bacteriocin/lantibiotic exporter with double-glycine peptidase domain